MKETACLLIHGLAGSRKEVAALERFLHAKGIPAQSVNLYGHGGTKEALARSNYTQWIRSAESELIRLQSIHRNVIIIGFSMGGLIAVNLMGRHTVQGAVFINTPIYYWDVKRIIINLRCDFKTYFKRYFKSSTDKAVGTLFEFVKLLNRTKKMFDRVGERSLIIQALDDDTVRYKSAQYISKHVKGQRTLKFYDMGGHDILLSCNKDLVFQDVFDFIHQLNDQCA